MYIRSLKPPDSTFFLFGARGTGKSTWLKHRLNDAFIVDLLPTAQSLRFERDPSLFGALVRARPKEQWIIVDEIQKVPSLLDDVHALIENDGYRKFALSGSSARKLKRNHAKRNHTNLLAGRAITRRMFPLTAQETNFEAFAAQAPRFDLLRFGMLPLVVTANTDAHREDILSTYIDTYLREEIKQEALVRNIGSFARFTEVAALAAGQRVNISGIARDSGVTRDTARGYFDVLIDTLMGSWLPAFRPRAKIKENAKSKFYWFDSGVLNAAAGYQQQPAPADWTGVLLEHMIHHELTAYMHYHRIKGTLSYWRTPSGSEVDFVWHYGDSIVAIEAKSTPRYRRQQRKGIDSLRATKALKAAYIVNLGHDELLSDDVRILPLQKFLQELHAGNVIG